MPAPAGPRTKTASGVAATSGEQSSLLRQGLYSSDWPHWTRGGHSRSQGDGSAGLGTWPHTPLSTHPGVPLEPFHSSWPVYAQTPQPPKHPITSLFDGGGGAAPAFPGTTSWSDTAQLLTTLTTASRLMLAPLTWTWPCSIEMPVEVGAWAGGRGDGGSLPHFSFLRAATDCGGASSL